MRSRPKGLDDQEAADNQAEEERSSDWSRNDHFGEVDGCIQGTIWWESFYRRQQLAAPNGGQSLKVTCVPKISGYSDGQ